MRQNTLGFLPKKHITTDAGPSYGVLDVEWLSVVDDEYGANESPRCGIEYVLVLLADPSAEQELVDAEVIRLCETRRAHETG